MTWIRHISENTFCPTDHCYVLFPLQIYSNAYDIHQLSIYPFQTFWSWVMKYWSPLQSIDSCRWSPDMFVLSCFFISIILCRWPPDIFTWLCSALTQYVQTGSSYYTAAYPICFKLVKCSIIFAESNLKLAVHGDLIGVLLCARTWTLW